MKTRPLVSILIPVYNREKIVIRSIESALSQTYSNIEVIVNDNASTDETWMVLKKCAESDDRMRVYRNEENLGPVKNWVQCLKHAHGEYVKILWSDDTISPDFIEKTLPALESNPSVGFAYTKTEIIVDGNKNIVYKLGDTGIYPSKKYLDGALFDKNDVPVSPGCALFRKKDVEKNLIVDLPNPYGWDFSKLGAGNDLLLFLTPTIAYKSIYYVNECLSQFYGDKDSISVRNISRIKELYSYAKLYFVRKFCNETTQNKFCTYMSVGDYGYLLKNVVYKRIWLEYLFCKLRRIKKSITVKNK